MTERLCLVLMGADSSLRRCQAWLGAGLIYLPRYTVRVRVSGRSRRTERREVMQYPGYGFLRHEGLRHEDVLSSRWGLSVMRNTDGAPVVVEDAQLEYARMLEAGLFDHDEPPPAPPVRQQDPRIGDRNNLDLWSTSPVRGTVIAVSGDIVTLSVDRILVPVTVHRSQLLPA